MSTATYTRVVVSELYRVVMQELAWVPLLATAAIKKLRGD